VEKLQAKSLAEKVPFLMKGNYDLHLSMFLYECFQELQEETISPTYLLPYSYVLFPSFFIRTAGYRE
jgi:hypothetical protein